MSQTNNYLSLLEEISWLESVIHQVIRSYLKQEGHEQNWEDIPMPDLTESETPYALLIQKHLLGKYERVALSLALAPHLKPEVLDVFFGKNQLYDRGFTEFGGVVNDGHSGFIPTIQTLHFILSANQPENRLKCMQLYATDSILTKEDLLDLHSSENSFSPANTMLNIDSSWLDYFISGERKEIPLGSTFPAQKISTAMEWEDVVLNDKVVEQLEDMVSWLQNSETLMNDWGLSKMLKPGFRALFYGAPGTGKTFTATLLGKATQREVYKVDLSMIVSKYIGETEKNLARVFDLAQNKNWILFFDEADALFGKRTEANSSNDSHANQQTAYLLQKIEDFPGVVILASNLKANMDAAFTRRFQAMIHFPMPDAAERLRLWKNAFSMGCQLEEKVDVEKIAESYELAGGAVINVLRFCALKAIKKENKLVTQSDLMQGIKIEYQKMNKTLAL